ncbi:SERTA domain-containing protein 3 [Marasmius crinis-equi]|uniref:SERTA domain-containing protein 3 n=1 Tax=Marasmius crinis-equi TaxID=585013 RepID=A0ABR3EMV6_9AGAR
MGGLTAFTGARLTFLQGERERFSQAATSRTVATYMDELCDRYFRRFPETEPHNVDPDPAVLAAVDDNSEDDPHPPAPERRPGQPLEEFEREMEEYRGLETRILFRMRQILRWMRYHTKNGLLEAHVLYLNKLAGIDNNGKPGRRSSAYNLWYKHKNNFLDEAIEEAYKEKKAVFEKRRAEGGGTIDVQDGKVEKAPARVAIRQDLVKGAFDALSKEEQKDWQTKAAQEHRERTQKWSNQKELHFSTDPEDRQHAIDELRGWVMPLLEGIQGFTGLNVSMFCSGPIPADQGKISVLGFHQGRTIANPCETFGMKYREQIKTYLNPMLADFCVQTHTLEECRRSSLGADAELGKLFQTDDVDMQPLGPEVRASFAAIERGNASPSSLTSAVPPTTGGVAKPEAKTTASSSASSSTAGSSTPSSAVPAMGSSSTSYTKANDTTPSSSAASSTAGSSMPSSLAPGKGSSSTASTSASTASPAVPTELSSTTSSAGPAKGSSSTASSSISSSAVPTKVSMLNAKPTAPRPTAPAATSASAASKVKARNASSKRPSTSSSGFGSVSSAGVSSSGKVTMKAPTSHMVAQARGRVDPRPPPVIAASSLQPSKAKTGTGRPLPVGGASSVAKKPQGSGPPNERSAIKVDALRAGYAAKLAQTTSSSAPRRSAGNLSRTAPLQSQPVRIPQRSSPSPDVGDPTNPIILSSSPAVPTTTKRRRHVSPISVSSTGSSPIPSPTRKARRMTSPSPSPSERTATPCAPVRPETVRPSSPPESSQPRASVTPPPSTQPRGKKQPRVKEESRSPASSSSADEISAALAEVTYSSPVKPVKRKASALELPTARPYVEISRPTKRGRISEAPAESEGNSRSVSRASSSAAPIVSRSRGREMGEVKDGEGSCESGKRKGKSKEKSYIVCLPDDCEPYLERTMELCSRVAVGEQEELWVALTAAYVALEVVRNYKPGKLDTDGRPAVVGNWIKHARSPRYRPPINVADFRSKFAAWWWNIAPDWRRTEGEDAVLLREDGDWTVLYETSTGLNGLSSVMAALAWWLDEVQNLPIKTPRERQFRRQEEEEWAEAASDVLWSYEEMLKL